MKDDLSCNVTDILTSTIGDKFLGEFLFSFERTLIFLKTHFPNSKKETYRFYMTRFQSRTKPLIKNDCFLLDKNAEGSILYLEYFSTGDFKEDYQNQLLTTVQAGKFLALIIKIENGNILPTEDRSWIEHLDLLLLFEAGISRIAYVSPGNIFSSLEIEKELKTGAVIRIKIFKKISDAIFWIESGIKIK